MDRRPDPYRARARELAVAAGYADPDVKIEQGPGLKPWPAWCAFRKTAQDEQYGPRIAPVKDGAPFKMLIEAENELEQSNIDKCREVFERLTRIPVVKAGAVMPDACPNGPEEITVGGVIASEGIHPGMHSADICCSMAFTNLGQIDPVDVMDAVQRIAHFGPGGRGDLQLAPSDAIMSAVVGNPFLSEFVREAKSHHITCGNGNHFVSVGRLRATGDTVIVSHFGSRGLGAALYRKGMATAESYRKRISPETLACNAWIPADTTDGDNYWKALQIVRTWTKSNHFTLHDRVADAIGAKIIARFWNEHNFVFRRTDGLFYHGKGATPAWKGFAEADTDTCALTIIPLNMAEPILIVRGKDNPDALGFSPHGAGRNMSRTAHRKTLEGRSPEDVLKEETKGLDVRFFCGTPDLTELPSAYKNAQSVRAQIEKFNLAEIVDEVMPFGTIMAGDEGWALKRRRKKKANAKRGGDRDEGVGTTDGRGGMPSEGSGS